MTVDGFLQQLRKSLGGGPTLRDIDGELPVPWTLYEWGILIAAVLGIAAVTELLRRWSVRRRQARRISFVRLNQRLGRINQARLGRELTLEETVLAAADVLKQALILAAHSGDGVTKHRTTKQWSQWCRERCVGRDVTASIQQILRHADEIKFAGGSTSLRDVRLTLDRTFSAVRVLADLPGPVSSPPTTGGKGR